MGFFKRLFSADYRAAIAAEAAGDLELAAEHYALADKVEDAVRIHLARAGRADRRADEISALRDAHHWSPIDSALRRRVSRALGAAILARAEAEGVATARDKEHVRDAAVLLLEAEDFEAAGSAFESIDQDDQAASAFKRGGLVERMEEVLQRQERRTKDARVVRQSFADYELYLRGGDRDAAHRALVQTVEAASDKSEYRRLLDQLESRLITGGRVVLIGRDALCDLVLRTGGISRRHSEVTTTDGFQLADAGSKNGTLVGGIPISGSLPLAEQGQFSLGEDCHIDFTVDRGVLHLTVAKGADAGASLYVTTDGTEIVLDEPPARLHFSNGRPILSRRRIDDRVTLNGEPLAHGQIQLIHGDEISIDGHELVVA